jgi:putative PIG3 family NAD(P)H quinone oxidoreductase
VRAVVLESYGDVDALQLRDVPDPEPGPDEVLVDVAATALNRADLLQRMGLYPGPPMAHEIPGMEFSGTVAGVGARVASVAVGDRVMGIVGGGAYAERLVTHERMVMPVPTGIALADAAAIPEVFVTAFDALVAQGGLTSGRTALVHAGASGVGTAAIQITRAIGATIIVTTSTAKVDACRDLGADVVVDYRTEDFVDVVRDRTAGRGVDVVLDVVGGDYVARNVACIATGGRIIQVGVMGSGKAEVNVGALLAKRAALVGTTLRSRPIEEKIAICRRFATEMLPFLADGAMRPVIDSRYPLDDVAAAHTYMQSNANVGKIVLDVAGASGSST